MRKLALLILDGAGYAADSRGNAVTQETMPNLFETFARNGVAVLEASGTSVGLEEGQVGNSEAGHLTIGAGCVVPSTVRRLTNAFTDGSWAADAMWQQIAGRGVLHIAGLVSDAGVHGLARTMGDAAHLAAAAGVAEIFVHPVLDGVDSRAGTAPALLDELQNRLAGIPGARLGVVIGRKWFCDRGGDLDVSRVASRAFTGASELPEFSPEHLTGHLDTQSEMSFPAHLSAGGRVMAAGETVLISNHRADRIRQTVTVLAETQRVVTIVDPGVEPAPEHVFFPVQALTAGLAHELKALGLTSKRIAEKCKFPHVTHFFNGFGVSVEGDGVCIPSIPEGQIPEQPEMSLAALTEEIISCLRDPRQKVVIANICNLDQVGHTGRFDLAARAADAVDKSYDQIAAVAREYGWTLLVTADHGNADLVETPEGEPYGSHTSRPVPLTVEVPHGVESTWVSKTGSLANVAATCLGALDVTPPDWMEPALISFDNGEQS